MRLGDQGFQKVGYLRPAIRFESTASPVRARQYVHSELLHIPVIPAKLLFPRFFVVVTAYDAERDLVDG